MANGKLLALACLGAILLSAGRAPAADLCLDMRLRCNGFEPNWQFTTGRDAAGNTIVRFVDPENPNWQTQPLVIRSCLLQGSPNDFEISTAEPLGLLGNITEQTCIEPNGDRAGFSINATFNQGALTSSPREVGGTGCCRRAE